MFDQLESVCQKYDDILGQMQSDEIIADYVKYSELNKTLKEIEPIVILYRQYKTFTKQLAENKEMLIEEKDDDMKEIIKEDILRLEDSVSKLEKDIKQKLVPQDPNDIKNAILEIRAGTGGDEAGIFAGDLFRMYCRYCERKKLKVDIVNSVDSASGGYKEIVCNIMAQGAYGILKFESGVHRVQRIPITETQGRIHTSAASVVVLPEVDDIDVQINMNDIRKDTFCSTGAGGQGVNTTYSAVRVTHIPTGLVVTCQDERSQMKNFDKALKVLRSRLYDIELGKQQNEIGSQKRSMVKHGDRSDKIRTYNYPQNRITDHRINLTSYNLETVMNGELDDFIDALHVADNASKLEEEIDV